MPGAVRGVNGVVHINGDHGVINYMIDGVALPQELNRDIGGEINLNDLLVRRPHRGCVSGAIRPAVRFGVQYVDASRDRSGGLRWVCVVAWIVYDVDDVRLSRADCRRRRVLTGRRAINRPAGFRPGQLRLAAQRRQFGQPVRAPGDYIMQGDYIQSLVTIRLRPASLTI